MDQTKDLPYGMEWVWELKSDTIYDRICVIELRHFDQLPKEAFSNCTINRIKVDTGSPAYHQALTYIKIIEDKQKTELSVAKSDLQIINNINISSSGFTQPGYAKTIKIKLQGTSASTEFNLTERMAKSLAHAISTIFENSGMSINIDIKDN